MIQEGFIIALWAWLWCSVVTADGEILAPAKRWLYRRLITPNGQERYRLVAFTAYRVLAGCPKCHAFWLSILLGLVWGVGVSIELTLTATGVAAFLERK